MQRPARAQILQPLLSTTTTNDQTQRRRLLMFYFCNMRVGPAGLPFVLHKGIIESLLIFFFIPDNSLLVSTFWRGLCGTVTKTTFVMPLLETLARPVPDWAPLPSSCAPRIPPGTASAAAWTVLSDYRPVVCASWLRLWKRPWPGWGAPLDGVPEPFRDLALQPVAVCDEAAAPMPRLWKP